MPNPAGPDPGWTECGLWLPVYGVMNSNSPQDGDIPVDLE